MKTFKLSLYSVLAQVIYNKAKPYIKQKRYDANYIQFWFVGLFNVAWVTKQKVQN